MKYFVLCGNRHEFPSHVDGKIWDEIVDPTNVAAIEKRAAEFITENMDVEFCVYVTGLTVCSIALCNAALSRGKVFQFLHYDRETEDYFAQQVGGYISYEV